MNTKAKRRTSLARKLLRLPPIICFVIARQGKARAVRALGAHEIARRSGLPIERVMALSWATSWDDISCREMQLFSKACGVNFDSGRNLKLHTQYLKRRKGRFPHLTRLPNYSEYRDRIELYRTFVRDLIHS